MRAVTDLDRRSFIRRAGVAGALAWTAPLVLTIEPAGAATRHSAPPGTTPPVTVPPVETLPPPEPAHVSPKPAPKPTGGLPYTGEDTGRDLALGAALLATGAATIAATNPKETR